MEDDEITAAKPEQTEESGVTEVEVPAAATETLETESQVDEYSEIRSSISKIEADLGMISDSSAKMANEVREMHKLYHNEFASRLKTQQDELERYHEIEKGRVFDGILGDIAKLYSDNETVSDGIVDEKIAKKVRYMLEDMVQIMEANGVSRQKSKAGDKRNPKFCQVVERITTDKPALHDTVVKSRNTGFYKDVRPIIKEMVDIYLYSEKE
ncbi:MAG: nucleotide exchange factor GrpE [Spirochaetaceae bacterium]|jgi:molecular chaperone GrpE (heat shock protein)|nr:nucleotide exchange factor GrpE [Spirochaetaceae bacterium]